MICAAPARRATRMAHRPMGPQPMTSTERPARSVDRAVCTALPRGSITAATSTGVAGSIFRAFCAGRTTKSVNAPSRSTPMIWSRSQMCASPRRQAPQRPQLTWDSPDTKSPGATPCASGPISVTVPQNSWPMITGGRRRDAAQGSHLQMWRSVPQMPPARTWTRTWPGPGLGIGTERISRPGPAAGLTSARIVPTRI